MSVNDYMVADLADVNEGDRVVISEQGWGTRTLREATVIRKTKARFTVADDTGVEKTYRSTISPTGALTARGKSGATTYTTTLYRATDEVMAWFYFEAMKREVKTLRARVDEHSDRLKNSEWGDVAADAARSLSDMAKTLARLEVRLADYGDRYLA